MEDWSAYASQGNSCSIGCALSTAARLLWAGSGLIPPFCGWVCTLCLRMGGCATVMIPWFYFHLLLSPLASRFSLPGLLLWLIHGELCFWFRVTFVLLSGSDWPRHTLEQATDCFAPIVSTQVVTDICSAWWIIRWILSYNPCWIRFSLIGNWSSACLTFDYLTKRDACP